MSVVSQRVSESRVPFPANIFGKCSGSLNSKKLTVRDSAPAKKHRLFNPEPPVAQLPAVLHFLLPGDRACDGICDTGGPLRLTRSAQVEAGDREVGLPGGRLKGCAWADWLHGAASGLGRSQSCGRTARPLVVKMNSDELNCDEFQRPGRYGDLYWITSSARASSDGGIVRPSAVAIFRSWSTALIPRGLLFSGRY
jgi:hypothetical protein